MAECTYEGCTRPGQGTQGICKPHQTAEWHARQGPCSIEDCDRQAGAGGICVTHYRRRRDGVPNWDAVVPRNMKRGAECSVDGCTEPVAARGQCQIHYQRSLRTGDPGPAERLRAEAGAGSSDGRGYRVITVDGQRYLEHRWVMEQILGRPLEPDEEVHHKNRIRDDNDPSNLELWAVAQPRGGRVSDLVAFIVGRYPAEVRAALARMDAQRA